VGGLAALLTAARLAREVTPANPFVRKLLERLRHNQRASGAMLPLPGPVATPETEDDAEATGVQDWLLKGGRWLREAGAAVFADPEAAQARLQYRFFKVSSGVFNSLQFQSVARG
jgi:anti-sigma factor ChrR (cupin superfamily)